MKKLLLSFAAGLLSLSTFAQSDGDVEYTYSNGAPEAATELVDNGLYFIYDTYSGRNAMRYVNTSQSNKIYGTGAAPMTGQKYNDKYVWEAIKVADGWQFKNIGTDLYIPSRDGNTQHLVADVTPGTFTLVESGSALFSVRQTNNDLLRWDGNNDSDRIMAIWSESNHLYQFYSVAEVTEERTLVVTFKKGDEIYGTASINLVGSGATYTLPTELGTFGEEVDDAVTFTFAENVTPFKMVNARHIALWLSSSPSGLTRTSTTFDEAEWFVQYTDGEGIKIFSPAQGKYIGSMLDSSQVPLVISDYATTMTIVHNQNGPIAISNLSHNLGFNIWDGQNHSGSVYGYRYIDGNSYDTSCFWFIVYDNEAFEQNKQYYLRADGTTPSDGQAHFTNNNAWYQAQQNAKDVLAISAGVDADKVSELQALVDAAAVSDFGKQGTNIGKMIEQMNSLAEEIQTLAMRTTVTFVKGDVEYGSHLFIGPLPSYPESVGTMGEIENNAATFTFADDANPFKLVSARYSGVWGSSNADGLYHSSNAAGNFDDAELFAIDGDESSFTLFSIIQCKYVGALTFNKQAPFSNTPQTFSIVHSQSGPVAIKGNDDRFLNEFAGESAGNIGAWYKTKTATDATLDAGSFWFLVFDNEAYELNKNYYWNDNTGFSEGNLHTGGALYGAIQDAYTELENAGVAPAAESDEPEEGGSADVTANAVASLQSVLNEAENVHFGVKGTDVSDIIERLQSATNTLREVTSIEEIEATITKVVEGIYDLQGRRLSVPVKGINIINGKKVLVK